jgi:hypothetical protein
MAFKMRGFNPGVGTGLGSAFTKKTEGSIKTAAKDVVEKKSKTGVLDNLPHQETNVDRYNKAYEEKLKEKEAKETEVGASKKKTDKVIGDAPMKKNGPTDGPTEGDKAEIAGEMTRKDIEDWKDVAVKTGGKAGSIVTGMGKTIAKGGKKIYDALKGKKKDSPMKKVDDSKVQVRHDINPAKKGKGVEGKKKGSWVHSAEERLKYQEPQSTKRYYSPEEKEKAAEEGAKRVKKSMRKPGTPPVKPKKTGGKID